MNPGVQVFLYPEELDHAGPEELAAQVLELGCDAVSVAVAYHRARRVFPRHRRVSVLARSTLYLAPQHSRYGSLVPHGVESEPLLRFREACDRAGLRFRAWVVGLHNDDLAAAHPEAAARLLDGSPAGHSLCPSAPEAVEYVSALTGDVAARLNPEAVDLEAGFYPAWEPSYTLTLALDPLSERARLFGAQCFCTSCRGLFKPDAETRAGAAAGPPFGAGAVDGGVAGELAAGRAEGAARLVEAVAASVHAEGALLRVFASGPPEQAALQGVSRRSVAAADAVLYGCGPLGGDELLERFAGLRALSGRTGTVSTNWTPARTLAADAERLAAAGAEGLALYNLTLVPEAGVEAFAAAARAFRVGGPRVIVIDGHVMLGESRDASLSADELLATMDRLGIDRALVSPAEGFLPIRNREGNELAAAAASASGGRLIAYAVATPWLGVEALEELRRARDLGARALKLDPALQGFDLLDGQAEPLVVFALESGWPVYVRTGTPPHALPLQVAWLAARFPEAAFLLGKSGATDFSHDGPATLTAAPNVYADSVYVEWPTALAAADPEGRGGRVFFSTDSPFGDPAIELARVTEAPYGADVRDAILGGTLARLLGL